MKCLLGLLIGLNASASIVNLNPAKEFIAGIKLSTSAVYSDQRLQLTGVGLGKKKVGLTHVNVAVNQFFSLSPINFVRTVDGALLSLEKTGFNLMVITFLRTLDQSQIADQIDGYLSANLTPQEKEKYSVEIALILNAIATEPTIYAGKSIVILCDPYRNQVVYENTEGRISRIDSQPGFLTKVMSVWFGNTINQDAFNLKQWLLQEPKVTPAL